MPRESLRQVLKKVDPDLKVIPGGTRRHRYPQNSQENWVKAIGVFCSNCGHEVFQSRDGLCMNCWEKANEYEVRDKVGAVNFLPMSVIMEIARPARKEE